MGFRVQGTSSTGETFFADGSEFGKVFDRFDVAFDYAVEYAYGVSGTDAVYANRETGWVRAVGDDYSETLRIV